MKSKNNIKQVFAGAYSYLRLHPCIVSFLLSLIMLFIYSLIQEIAPFGDITFLRKDLYHQYLPFLYELKRKLSAPREFGYSFDLGLGSSFYALYVYYLSDPLNLLCVFIPRDRLLGFLTIVTYLKIALSSSFMCIYLRYRAPSLRKINLVILSMCYAFSGYAASYDWNVMWMWGIALAPLSLMGFEKAVKEGHIRLFLLSMAIIVWTNYYIAMLLFIFFLIYYPVCCIEGKNSIKDSFVNGARVLFASVLAAGVSAVLLLPEYAAIKKTSFSGTALPSKIRMYLSLPELLLRLLPDVAVETGLGHEPALYFSIGALMLVPLYFMNSKIRLVDRITRAVLIVFFFISFNMNLLEYFWHGLNYPDSIPARQAFIFVIIMLLTAAEGLGSDRDVEMTSAYRWIKISVMSLFPMIIFFVCFVFCRDEEHTDIITWFLSGGFVIFYICAVFLYVLFRDEYEKWGIYAISMILFMEIMMNFNLTSLRDISREKYFVHQESFASLAQVAENSDSLNQGHFTRLDVSHQNIRNISCLVGYHDASYFSSTIDGSIPEAYEDLGMKSSRVHYMASGMTPFTASLLGAGYILADDYRNNCTDFDVASFLDEYGEDYLFELNWRLPFGYTVPSGSCMSKVLDASRDPVDRQDQLAYSMGYDHVFESIDREHIDEETGKTLIHIPKDGHYYAYSHSNAKEISEYIEIAGDEAHAEFSDMKYESIMDLGRLEKDDIVTLKDEECDEKLNISLYRLVPEAMDDAIDGLKETSLTLTGFSDCHIEGLIDISSGRDLILQMPYDTDWEIVMDGYERLEPDSFCGLLMRISIPEGLHHISLTYHIPYLIPGIILSVISVIIILISQWGRFSLTHFFSKRSQ